MATEAKTITTRGDLIVGGASGVLSRIGLGTGGYTLTSDGTDVLWKPAIVNSVVNDFGRTISNTTTESSLLSGGAALPTGFQAAAVGDMWEINFGGLWTNASGAGQTLTLRLYFGSLAVVGVVTASATSNANSHTFWGRVLIVPRTIGGGGGGTANVHGIVTVSVPTTATLDNLQAAASSFWSGNASLGFLTTNAAQPFNITGQMSTASASASIASQWVNMRYIPKGF
jgi:hypothetical protein